MNIATLIWSALKRHKAQTLFTFLSVVVAFVLFSVLAAVRQGTSEMSIASAGRLNTLSAVSPGAPMPLSYYDKIVSVPGVAAADYFNGFPGHFRDPKNAVHVIVTQARDYLKVYPEYQLPAAQREAWFADRQGVIVGPTLAKRMGWKVGDTVPIQSKLPHKDGSTTWYFHVDGIYQADLPATFQSLFLGHYQYVQEGIGGTLPDQVNTYSVRVGDPRDVAQVSDAIDKLFANASIQTLTEPETAEAVDYARQFGNVTAMVIYVGIAVFFSLLLIIGNSLIESVQERTAEFAMFRALGFKRLRLSLLVMQETLLPVVAGGIAGLILGLEAVRLLTPGASNILQTFGMGWNAVAGGLILSVLFGLLVSLIPVQWVTRLRVADALRKA